MEVLTTSKEIAKSLENLGVEVKTVERKKPFTVLRKNDVEIRYLAIPLKNEFEPFLKTVKSLLNSDPRGKLSANVKVFVSPFCPHCAKVIENVNSLAVENPNLRVEIIDVSYYPEMAERYGVVSAPTTVINDCIKLIGYLSVEEIVEWIEKSENRYEYFAKLLKAGRLEELLNLIKSKEDLSIVVKLLDYGDFMVRLGAMVLIENLFESNPKTVESIKGEIKRFLRHKDSRIRQDVAMLLGKIGDLEDLEDLKTLLNDERDVVESVEEAIEEIKRRCKP